MLAFVVMSGCKSGILISDIKIPFSNICGSQAAYRCRATGIGAIKPTTKIYEEERPDGSDKSETNSFYNLGRAVNLNAFNDTYKSLTLKPRMFTIDTAKINYDLKGANLKEILGELDAALKEENIETAVSAQISEDFKSKLENSFILEAYMITGTIKSDVIDSLRRASKGTLIVEPYYSSAQNLLHAKRPLIRQVMVVCEICDYKVASNLSSILSSVLRAKLGVTNPKADLVLKAAIKKKKTTAFSSSFKRTSIYSYGYLNDDWMN